MREKVSQMFKDKLLLVMLVLGLLTIVAAAGVVTVQRGNKSEGPGLEMQESQGLIAQETVPETQAQLAGNSNAADSKKNYEAKDATKALTEGEIDEPIAQVGAGKDSAKALTLNFTDTSKMTWPVKGNVLLDYSMDSTIYFQTLDQFKCNPAIVVQGDVSTPVSAPANAKVLEVGSNEEIGNYVVLDLGNDYTATCGQLKEVQVVVNEYIEQGKILGYVAEPTKYYSVEGANIYFELEHGQTPIDPLDYIQ